MRETTVVPDTPTSPVLSSDALTTLAHQILDMTTVDVASVTVTHRAAGITRVSRNHVRLTDSGDTLQLALRLGFGGRGQIGIRINQIDPDTLHRAVQYLERIAHEQPGDPAPTPRSMPLPSPPYPHNTSWSDGTARALSLDRHGVAAAVVRPVLEAGLTGTAFIGVAAESKMYADKQGACITGQSTDAEIAVTAWDPDSPDGPASSGWAGAASRSWGTLDSHRIAADAVHLARLASHPIKLEPGRRTAILGRPAMAQIVRAMGRDYDAGATLMGFTPLSDHKLHDRILDTRITLRSDPNDPDGGYLPFTDYGDPRYAMTWLEHGRLTNLAYAPRFAATSGVAQGNPWPESLRLTAETGPLLTVDEMIANCAEGIYVNRVADIDMVHRKSGLLTGVTSGGCFLIRNGKIEKAVKDFRFMDSAYFFLNKLVAVGQAERTAFGYAPWHGEWPIAPTIVPPVMVHDFNFSALAENV